MKKNLGRRDFLKLAGLVPFGLIAPPLLRSLNHENLLEGDKKNVLVVVFDAFSAYHVSLYGYGRKTTPNLAKFANRAHVYHNHFAGGSFTTPGTASLLTMTLPWTHRAMTLGAQVSAAYADKSVFHAFNDYYRIGYTHNPLANTLLKQFHMDINEYIPTERLLITSDAFIGKLFPNDEDIASVGWLRDMKREEFGYSYSIFLSHLYEKYQDRKIAIYNDKYPNGIPRFGGDNYYTLEDGINWLESRIKKLPNPFFAYFHFFPPHFPYRPSRDYYDHFANDKFKTVAKPQDLFAEVNSSLSKPRESYDEFILNVDGEFGRLFNSLEASGLLENTWVVLTSDHGEMLERGIAGHTTPTLYQPLVRVPLMIFEPGNQSGQDIYTHTSATDVMTTLLHITGHPIPTWSEGYILPPFTKETPPTDRRIYTVQAKHNKPDLPLTETTVSQVLGNYKLIYYLGYSDQLGTAGEKFQLFDISGDPDELNDLSTIKKDTASELLNIVKEKLKQVNQPYL